MSPLDRGWESMAPLNRPRVHLSLLDNANCIYAIGGRYGEQAVAIVERYDPERDVWHETSSMNKARCFFGCTESDGTLYVVDGMKDNACVHKSSEMFDPRIVVD